jgi:hypothetical protein
MVLFLKRVQESRTAIMSQTKPAFFNWPATRINVAAVGVLFGIGGMNHGLFEFLQGNKPSDGLIIQAIGPEQRFWVHGTEEAFTIIPNFMLTGLAAMLVGLLIIIWSLFFIERKHGATVFLGLFILLFLVGGGIGQIVFFVPTWAFATRLNKPLTGWRKILPRRSWGFLSWVWLVTLILFIVTILVGLEMAVFGYFPGLTDPDVILNTTLLIVLSSAIFNIISFIAGFGHELRRMEHLT